MKGQKSKWKFKKYWNYIKLEILGLKCGLSTWNIDFQSKYFILAINKNINIIDNNNLHLYYTVFKFSVKMINKRRNRP